jgi:hypothetical protein
VAVIVVAAIAFVVGLIGAAVLPAVLIVTSVVAVTGIEYGVTGIPWTVAGLDGDTRYLIYETYDPLTGCSVSDTDGSSVAVSRPSDRETTTDNGIDLVAVYQFKTSGPGDYTVTCDADAEFATYGVGRTAFTAHQALPAVLGVLGLAAMSFAGFVFLVIWVVRLIVWTSRKKKADQFAAYAARYPSPYQHPLPPQ